MLILHRAFLYLFSIEKLSLEINSFSNNLSTGKGSEYIQWMKGNRQTITSSFQWFGRNRFIKGNSVALQTRDDEMSLKMCN